MPLKSFRPINPSQRYTLLNKNSEVAKKRPEKGLVESQSKTAGRNCYGRLTSRRRGGGHKRLYRVIDFKRSRFDVPARVQAIEYDPNRSANLALIAYTDGEKSYILAPKGLAVGDTIVSAKEKAEFRPGNAMPLRVIPPSTFVHCLELLPGRGAQVARGAGNHAILVGVEGDVAQVRMPSGEIRLVSAKCRATVGEVGNEDHAKQSLGKAGRNRWLGRRPRVRGVAMNPVDHPMGGGQAKTSGGGHPVSPWGQLAKGFPTRRKSKTSNSLILVRRNGRKLKVR
jgi:large subunit ribosomal protein L2